MIKRISKAKGTVNIALVGKYTALKDAYISVNEALDHAGYFYYKKVNIIRIKAEDVNENNVEELLGNVDGILVPGGFGFRGIDGKMVACRYAREHKIPFLGICLGMQVALIEIARHVAKLEGADSTEFNPQTPYKIIDFLPGQYDGIDVGGTLRLGNYTCQIDKDAKAFKYYKEREFVQERHRHRYEFNNEFKNILEHYGVKFVGKNPETNLVEMIELDDHPWFVASQFHPEFRSRPNHPHPLFKGFIDAAINYQKEKE